MADPSHPEGSARAWLEARTGLSASLAKAVDYTVNGGPRWSHATGAALLALLGTLALTGIAMSTVYAPGVNTAWSSTYWLEERLPWGHIVRGVHHFAAHAMVALGALHLGVAMVARSYRSPREVTWLLTLAIGGLVLAFAITGFPLAWDQRGYWSSRIETGIIGSVPVAGPYLQRFVLGGAQYGALTLTRFYTLHAMVLPLALAGLVSARLGLARKLGIGTRVEGAEGTPWWPSQSARDAVLSAIVLAAVTYLGRRYGAPLDAPADPASHYPAVPEWFFSPLSQLLKLFPGSRQPIGTMVIPGLVTTYLAALPFIDRGTTLPRRALALTPVLLIALGAFALGRKLHRSTEAPEFARALREASHRAGRARALARQGVPVEGPLEMVRNDPEVRPQELFAQHCGTCHAANGISRERRAPRLDGFGSRQWAAAFLVWPDAPELMGTTQIHDMPSQQRRLRDDGVRAVSEWLYARGIEPGEPPADAALVAQGEALYRRRCTTCHQGAGDESGTEAADRDAPNLDAWGSRAYLRAQIETPGSASNYGARNHMTAFADRLSPREIEQVVDFMRRLRVRQGPAVVQPPAEE